MILIYTTNFHHEHASECLIGSAETKNIAIELLDDHTANNKTELSIDDVNNLHNINQTQGHNGDFEYCFKELNKNELM